MVGGLHEAGKERMGRERFRLELWMKLDGDEPGVRRQLDDLHELAVWRPS